MVYRIEVLTDTEDAGDLVTDLLGIDNVDIQLKENDIASPDESKKHGSYSLSPDTLTSILITVPAIITSFTGLAKVILDYKLKSRQNKPPSKGASKELWIVIDGKSTPLSKFSNPEELAQFIEEETQKPKSQRDKDKS